MVLRYFEAMSRVIERHGGTVSGLLVLRHGHAC